MKSILRSFHFPKHLLPLPTPPILFPVNSTRRVLRRGAQPRLSWSHRISKHASKFEYLRSRYRQSGYKLRKWSQVVMVVTIWGFCGIQKERKSSRVTWVCAECGQWWGSCHSMGTLKKFSEVKSGERHAEERTWLPQKTEEVQPMRRINQLD